jgi:hypothetical protein
LGTTEQQHFAAPKATRRNQNARGNRKFVEASAPRIGDRVFIWVNQIDQGKGLTAFGTVNEIGSTDQGIDFVLTHVTLLGPPYLHCLEGRGLRQFARGAWRANAEGYPFLDGVHHSRKVRTLELSAEDVIEIESILKISVTSSVPNLELAVATRHSFPNTRSDTSVVEAELQQERNLTWQLIELRQNQGPFRDGLIQRDNAKCAITGCRILQILEAAHLIPFASGDPARDSQQNGILLRADIHTLFDRGLMAIHADTHELWLAKELASSGYNVLAGRRIKTKAGTANIKHHFEWALRKSKNMD